MYQLEKQVKESIAIVGMALKVPGANTLDEFWDLLITGREAIQPKTKRTQTALSKTFFEVETFINHKKEFDASFFDVPHSLARQMDPQHRCFLECTWEAIENAGYTPKNYEGVIGLYAAAYANTYLYQNVLPSLNENNYLDNMELLMANEKDHIATLTAYKLGLTGPAVNVQSSCSSSLAAVHFASKGLLDYSCDMAIAGAATVGASLSSGYHYQDSGLLSKDGHVRPFDKNATGTIYSEGIGVVVLKRLEDAVEEHDHIYAVIRGSAINNDGSNRMGYTAPSAKGQIQVIRRAQLISEADTDSISYIEAHGTGTPLGDRIELEALNTVFNKKEQTGYCGIGSVKGNIGHTGPASGVIGLIKTALALEKRLLPPSINYENQNEDIDLFKSPFYINTCLQKWEKLNGIRMAGVSSFGLGGTNVHMIVEEAPQYNSEKEEKEFHIFALSAKTKASLQMMKEEYIRFLKKHDEESLRNIAYSLQRGRESFEYRYSCFIDSHETLIKELSEQNENQDVLHNRPFVLVLSDELNDCPEITEQLYQNEICFRRAYDRAATVINHTSGYAGDSQRNLCMAYALGKMCLDWGICFSRIEGIGSAAEIARVLNGEADLEQISCIANIGKDSNPQKPTFRLDDPRYEYIVFGGVSISPDCDRKLPYHVMFDEAGQIKELYQLFAKLWEWGYVKSFLPFVKDKPGECIAIPGYAFERQSYWIDSVQVSKPVSNNAKDETIYYIRSKEQLKDYEEPVGFLEKKLAEIWEMALGIKPIGLSDSFFQLGGTSLDAAKTNGIICDYFDIDIPLQEFVGSQTISALKRFIIKNNEGRKG